MAVWRGLVPDAGSGSAGVDFGQRAAGGVAGGAVRLWGFGDANAQPDVGGWVDAHAAAGVSGLSGAGAGGRMNVGDSYPRRVYG